MRGHITWPRFYPPKLIQTREGEMGHRVRDVLTEALFFHLVNLRCQACFKYRGALFAGSSLRPHWCYLRWCSVCLGCVHIYWCARAVSSAHELCPPSMHSSSSAELDVVRLCSAFSSFILLVFALLCKWILL
jgi:hypothetical protein